MKCPTCHIDLQFADEGQKRIEYCPNCRRRMWAFSSKLYPPGDSSRKGYSQPDAVPDWAGCCRQKSVSLGWDGRVGGLYLMKRKRNAALESLFYFLGTAAKHSL